MLVKNIADCNEFTAHDGCLIREVLHPKNDTVASPLSLAVARLPAGKASRPHTLTQTELYFILEGQGRMHINDETRAVGAADAILIPPRSVQWIENTADSELRFLAVVSPPWREEDDRQV